MTPRWTYRHLVALLIVAVNGFAAVAYLTGPMEPDKFTCAALSAVISVIFLVELTDMRAKAWRDLRTKRTP